MKSPDFASRRNFLKQLAAGIDKLAWTADGPRCAGPTYTPQPRPK
ncbi:MAG TPA: hypothetical protein VGC87_16475 [Pyrinomonadaceae bacterium]